MVRIELKRGLDISLGVRPHSRVSIVPSRVAVVGADFPGLRPHLHVATGDRVSLGDVLLTDRARPQVCFTAPAGGVVTDIHRGARRSLDLLIIETDGSQRLSAELPGPPSADAGVEDIRASLLRSGLWTAFRTRPFEQIPDPNAVPGQLFVTAIDTHPLAPDPATLILEQAETFEAGLRLLARLSPATYLCCSPAGRDGQQDLPCPEVPGLERIEFAGPHPAGLPGTHIQLLAGRLGRPPPENGIWHIGYQDVIAIGAWSAQGRLSNTRVVTVAGPALREGRLVETLAGADLGALIGSERIDGNTASRHGLDSATEATAARIISGPALSGRLTDRRGGYLGRYHQQVVMLPALSPAHAPARAAAGAGMLAVEAFDAVWPFAMPVAPLLRALLIEDTEAATALGATLLAPEDLALCEYVCPSRLDYGAALARTLDRIRRGG